MVAITFVDLNLARLCYYGMTRLLDEKDHRFKYISIVIIIHLLLQEETEDLHPNIVPTTDDIEKLVKDIYTCYPEDTCTLNEANVVTSSSVTDYESNVDLSWIIKETIGSEGLAGEPASLHEHVCADNFDLLEQLEAMQEDGSSVEPAPPIVLESVTAVANDHQYTQLASVTAKPHETKKQAMRRVKNNAASRVCRKQRRNRLTTNMGKVGDLMAQNEKLTQSIKQVEDLVSLLKEHLVKATCKK